MTIQMIAVRFGHGHRKGRAPHSRGGPIAGPMSPVKSNTAPEVKRFGSASAAGADALPLNMVC